MTLIKFLMIAGLASVALAPPALAQQPVPREPPCAERTHVIGKLQETFGERMVGSGLAESGVLFELYVGPAGTWTLLATTPGGVSCLVGAGEAWEPRPTPDMYVAR
ncbi:hypothetical protein FQV39_27515 [Bosea sp. F3-2]|uniref:hypothetical protein n=1 Tax=Bosea sp. F3-2 TaxID=2599640 RepID=UPI0011EF0856|nr:hypothetical protein [Bosea sp. F3-2]QEL25939.1 hypothetical protein FQV39_27515 [Bosea sp. F3-2]